jgi:hypothetical protein
LKSKHTRGQTCLFIFSFIPGLKMLRFLISIKAQL